MPRLYKMMLQTCCLLHTTETAVESF